MLNKFTLYSLISLTLVIYIIPLFIGIITLIFTVLGGGNLTTQILAPISTITLVSVIGVFIYHWCIVKN